MNRYSIFKTAHAEKELFRTYDNALEQWEIPYQTRMVQTSFGSTHLIICGPEEGKPLFMLHGMTWNSTMWYPNIKALSVRHRVIAVDVPGDFGKSRPSKSLSSREEAAAWLREVLERLQVKKAAFLSHCMGAWLTLNFAMLYPEHVDKMILLAPASGIRPLTLKFYLNVYLARRSPTEKSIRRLYSWLMAKHYRPDAYANLLLDQIVAFGTRCTPQLQVSPKKFTDRELSGLIPKTLVIAGNREVLYDYHKMLQRAAQLIPNVVTKVISDAGHAVSLERPDLINQISMDFLK